MVRIRRSHRRGPGSIPGVGMLFFFFFLAVFSFKSNCQIYLPKRGISILIAVVVQLRSQSFYATAQKLFCTTGQSVGILFVQKNR